MKLLVTAIAIVIGACLSFHWFDTHHVIKGLIALAVIGIVFETAKIETDY